ncbi:unnamed protein product, partial [Closterium sp. NIES-54]
PSAPPLGPLTTTATAATTTATTAALATAAPEYCATMTLLQVLAFDHEGRPVAFDTWHDDLQLYLLSDIKDSVSLFDHVSGVAPAPPARADGSTRSHEIQSPQQLREWLVQRGTGGGSETCLFVIRTGVRAGQTCGKFHSEHRCFSCLDDAWRAEFGDDIERPCWTDLLRSGVTIFDLDNDDIISAMYALSFSAEGDCHRCVPPDPGIAAAALGARASGTPPGTAPGEALHTFTLDFGASR